MLLIEDLERVGQRGGLRPLGYALDPMAHKEKGGEQVRARLRWLTGGQLFPDGPDSDCLSTAWCQG